jgi:mRNA-degrading endonuclease RelE of RelBE toxin-antitoxin system
MDGSVSEVVERYCEACSRAIGSRTRPRAKNTCGFWWLAIVLDAVDEQLTHQPTVETRNRKPLRPNPIAPWELRIGDLRVCYDVEDDPESIVHVRAIGVKQHNELRIGGEGYPL